jgi:hypothetical protein
MSYSTITFTRGDKDLTNMITSICWQSIPPKEVIIVHDIRWNYNIESDDVSKYSKLLKMFGITLILLNSFETSFAKMKNKFYNYIDTEIVLYVEDDSLIPQNYAETLLQRMKFSDKISSVGGCQLLTQNFPDIQESQIFKKQPIPFEQRYQRLIVKDSLLEYGSIKHQTQLYDSDPSTNLYCDALLHTYMLRMNDLRSVQGWDEDAPENGSLIFEEMDVMYRMNKLLEKSSVIVPNSVMWHFRGDNKREKVKSSNDRDLARLERKKYFGQKYINMGIS